MAGEASWYKVRASGCWGFLTDACRIDGFIVRVWSARFARLIILHVLTRGMLGR